MPHYLRNAILIILPAVIFSACSRIPDHARYIPKDAVAVAGVNLKSLGKKIAWNMITGSKLFKEIQQRIPEKNAKDAMLGIEKAGIDALNTFYVYVKPDTRFVGGNRITGLVPLSDAAQWEAYVKQVFPKAIIKESDGIKTAMLGKEMLVGWNHSLLIIMNALEDEAGNNSAGIAEIENAFRMTKENAITSDKHFSMLETKGHDVTFLLNYGLLLNQYSGEMAGKMGGMSLSAALWKDAVFTAGFDFRKGQISGDMKYFMPEDLKEIGTEFSAANANKDMIDRLPDEKLDMLLALHISPKGVKMALEKSGLLGLANVGLSSQGLNADYILEAFTGDMAIGMNNFSLATVDVTDTFMGQAILRQDQKPSLDVAYIIKINNKEHFNKLMDFARLVKTMEIENGFVAPLNAKDSIYVLMNDQYAVASNKHEISAGYLSGKYKAKGLTGTAQQAYGHPWALYFDIQQLFSNVNLGISSPHDSAMVAESRKLLNSIVFVGGEFRNSAFEYHLDINFTNTEENTIIELIDYGMKMSNADKIGDLK